MTDDGTTQTVIEYYLVQAGEYPVHMRPYGQGGGGSGALAKLDNIGDVNAPSPNDLEVVSWDAATQKWIPRAPTTPGSHTLDSHSDVIVPSPSPNEVLTWNGSAWVNLPAPGGGGGGDVSFTTGTVVDNQIARFDTNGNQLQGIGGFRPTISDTGVTTLGIHGGNSTGSLRVLTQDKHVSNVLGN